MSRYTHINRTIKVYPVAEPELEIWGEASKDMAIGSFFAGAFAMFVLLMCMPIDWRPESEVDKYLAVFFAIMAVLSAAGVVVVRWRQIRRLLRSMKSEATPVGEDEGATDA